MSTRASIRSAGFSLIELLVVVAIIGILAALAIPNLTSSRRAANEATAITYLKSWVSAQELYHLKYGVYADADNQLFDEGLIHGKGEADSHGYVYSLDNPGGSLFTWWGTAAPTDPGNSGTRWFYVDQSGVIRYSTTGTAGAGSPPL